MALSSTYQDLVLDHILGTTELTFDGTVFLALGTDVTPSKTTFTECTTAGTDGYARQAIVFTAAGTDGIAENAAGTLTFGPCTDDAWGTLKSWALYTAATGGTRIIQGALTDQTKTIELGDSATIAAGAIVVTATASSFSHACEDMILDHILGTSDMTFDSTVWLALGSDAATDKSTFTEIVAAGTKGYARQACDFNASGSDGIAENTDIETFGPCNTTNWGTIKSFAIFTDETSGTRLLQGDLTDQTKIVNIGDTATVAAGAIVVTAS